MSLHRGLGDLSERIALANAKPVLDSGGYVLVVLNRALRGDDNPVLDGAIAHAHSLNLPLLVYSELDETWPYASDRLFYFALGAFRALAKTLAKKGIVCIQQLKKIGDNPVLPLLIDRAAVIYTDQDYTHWDKAKIQTWIDSAQQSVFFVDASRLVPTSQLPQKLRTTPAFRKAHGALREKYVSLRCATNEALAEYRLASLDPSDLPTGNFATHTDAELTQLISQCDINHDIPISVEHPPTQAELQQRINRLKTDILSRYKWIRNNAALEHSTSQLSPYLHFGMLSPHQLLHEIESSDVPKTYTWKFRDEFLTWREWSHHQAFHNQNIHTFDGLSNSAKKTLLAHADDNRPELRTKEQILYGETPDPTWNAAQKEWLHTGWLHNNLRMYWSKQLLRFTDSPQSAWDMACYINDYISLDGRDPATYASMQWAFGNAKPGYSEKEIYGWVAPKSDRAILKRKGMKEWIEARQ